MSLGFTSSPAAEQEALKRIYAQKGGNCPGICAEGHRIRGRNVVRHANRDYCRKCVESGFVKIESRSKPRRPQSVYFIADSYGHVKIGYATSVEARFGFLVLLTLGFTVFQHDCAPWGGWFTWALIGSGVGTAWSAAWVVTQDPAWPR